MELPKHLRAELDTLLRDYARDLPQEVDGLEGLWDRFRQGDQEALKNLHRRLHTLAGSSASFGFGNVSDLARSLETLVAELENSWQQITAGLAELKVAARQPKRKERPETRSIAF